MGLFDFFKKRVPENKAEDTPKVAPQKGDRRLFERILSAARQEASAKGDTYYYMKPNEYASFTTQVLPLPDKQKVQFIIQAVEEIANGKIARHSWVATDADHQNVGICEAFMQHLLKTKMVLDDTDILSLYAAFSSNKRYSHDDNILQWPIGSLVMQLERQVKGKALSEPVKRMLMALKGLLSKKLNHYQQKDNIKLTERLDTLLFRDDHAEGVAKPTWFPIPDLFGKYANSSIEALDEKDRSAWFGAMNLCMKATAGKPSKKFLDEGRKKYDAAGPEPFKQVVLDWFKFIIDMKDGRDSLIAPANMDLIKGFVWICSHAEDEEMLNTIARLAERCYRKVPGSGAEAVAIGNACFFTLANAKGLEGVAHLSRLKLRIKQSNVQKLIDKYLEEAAKEEGVSVHEIEDMAVSDYGLTDGKAVYEFDGYKAVLEITGIGKAMLQWWKPDGTAQKTVPAFVKGKYESAFKKINDTAKQIELTLTAQRDRIDRMYKADRKMNWEQFNAFYFSHGLMSFLAKRLIWNVETDGKVEGRLFCNGRWVSPGRAPLDSLDKSSLLSLWHPAQSEVQAVTAWRDLILEQLVRQPFKQAFREVYLLTDAEINTRLYSNRMAAHILKQHQFSSLAKGRGWKYSLMGAYDNGRDHGIAEISIPHHGLRAEYWINEVNQENAMNDTGIWLYVATDQVRFIRTTTGEMTELISVPPIVLSEIMRDVDLFVGVASVGNDPEWRDNGGIPAYRDYWQSYSFGELTEVAKTRKQILERLLPRLTIGQVSEIKDKFLVVKGKLRTYKIHLGSTNILMEPNDQYLCIVPDRSPNTATDGVFLPFEGDTGLSIILSKALLLAADDKIKDETITRQINFVR